MKVSESQLEKHVHRQTKEVLELALEQMQEDAPQSNLPSKRFLMVFLTDSRVTVETMRKYQVLAELGHWICSRLLIVSREGHEQFYGQYVASKRLFSSISN